MDAKKKYVIGLDGGGTKTAAEICDLKGHRLAEAQGGPSNFQVIGVAQASETILDLVETCCHSVGGQPSEVAAFVAGLTGAGRKSDQQRMSEELKNSANRRNLAVGNFAVESDARIALEGAFLGKSGIIVIAGTGSIVFGKDEQGRIHRSGGWGRLIGDEGSGYAIGREAFRAVAGMMDGRGKKTLLAKLLAERFSLDSQEAIVQALYKENFDIASLFPAVLESAKRGDVVSRRILDSAANDLLSVIRATLLKMKKPGEKRKTKALCFVGGLIATDNSYSRKIRNLVRKIPRLEIQTPEASPVHGAVLMALEESQT